MICKKKINKKERETKKRTENTEREWTTTGPAGGGVEGGPYMNATVTVHTRRLSQQEEIGPMHAQGFPCKKKKRKKRRSEHTRNKNQEEM